MSKKISFKGQLPIGVQERIKLSTLNGKTGYKISKFQIMPFRPGTTSVELVGKIFVKDQTGNESPTVDFTDSNLLAVNYYQDNNSDAYPSSSDIIFDNEKFNQDIYIYIHCAAGSTQPANYYFELETMALSDLESTMMTLKSLRTLASR